MTNSTPIVEEAVLSYINGREVRFGRRHSSKTFHLLKEDGSLGFGYSRRKLNHRKFFESNCTGVSFRPVSKDGEDA